jgi:hypothetical protein
MIWPIVIYVLQTLSNILIVLPESNFCGIIMVQKLELFIDIIHIEF